MAGYFITFEGGEGAGKSTQSKLLYETLQREGYDVYLTREPGGTKGAEALRELLLFGQCRFSLRAEVMAHFTARCDHVDQVIRPAMQQNKIVICDRYSDSTLAYQGYGLGKADPEIIRFIQGMSSVIGLFPNLTFIFDASWSMLKERCKRRNRLSDQMPHSRNVLVKEDESDEFCLQSVSMDFNLCFSDKKSKEFLNSRLSSGNSFTNSSTIVNRNGISSVQKVDYYEQLDDAFHERILDGFRIIGLENPIRCHFIDANQPMMEIQQVIHEQVMSRLSVNNMK